MKGLFTSVPALLCLALFTISADAQDSSRFSHVTPEAFAKFEDHVQLDLLRLRLDPAAFRDEALFKYFVLLNNCSAPTHWVAENIDNEFEYPTIKKYYADHASEILNSLPLENVRTGGPSNSLLILGTYSRERKEFPFVNAYSRDATPQTLEIHSWGTSIVSRDVIWGCANRRMIRTHAQFPSYVVAREKLSFAAFPVEEQAARRFVETSKHREFRLRIASQILPLAPRRLERGGFVSYEFSSTVTRIDVLTPDGEMISTLYVRK